MADSKIKIVIIVGARPNFIKIAPLFWEFKNHKKIMPVLVHTGQHYDYRMSQVFFHDLDIPEPEYNLGIGSGTHATQTANALMKIEEVMMREKPDMAMMVGDINSALAGALAAVKLHIPIAHVEAGPRDFDMKKPEEVNRVIIDHISELNFCPTKLSVNNLQREGIEKGVFFTGDTMFDVFLSLTGRAEALKADILDRYGLVSKKYVLLTIHRQENADCPENLIAILQAMIESGDQVLFPVHPRTKKQLPPIIESLYGVKNFSNLHFTDPLTFIETIAIEKNAKMICTDSGGIQKEAYWSQVPCVTLMETTGWPETVESGWNVVAGANKKNILQAMSGCAPNSPQKKYFGGGNAAQIIVEVIESFF